MGRDINGFHRWVTSVRRKGQDPFDRLTKFAHFMEIKKTNTTKQIAEVFCKNVYKLKASQNSLSATEMQNLMENFGGNFSNKNITQYELNLPNPNIWLD